MIGVGSLVAATVVGLGLGLGFFFVLVVIEWGAWALVRPARKLNARDLEPPPWEPIRAFSNDGVKLSGAWCENEASAGRTVILLHGFAEDRLALWGRATAIHQRGWNVAMIDARGRGRSEGDLCSFGGREVGDLARWVDVIVERVGPSIRVLAWGRSMGAAIALRAAAADPRIAALVLEAPYPDLALTVSAWLRRARLPGVFARPILLRAHTLAGVSLEWPRPVDVAAKTQTPTLIVHGSDDRIVTLERGRRLASAFPRPVDWIEVAGARHSDVFEVGGSALVDRIAEFAVKAMKLDTLRSQAAAASIAKTSDDQSTASVTSSEPLSTRTADSDSSSSISDH
jgi:alpha-beta hydrolase superfamily lysophospholipase